MALSTSTSTLAAGASRTFNLSPGSALTLVAPPNVRATITETPNTVSASDVGGNASRTHDLQLGQTVTYGPYPMGGTVVVANASNSGATITWVRSDAIVAESAAGDISLVSGDGTTALALSLGLAPVSTPVGFRWTDHGLTLRRSANGAVQTDWLITDLIPTPTNTWYVNPLTGNDGTGAVNNSSLPLANLSTALAKADVDQIIITGLTADYIALGAKGWNNTQPTRSVSVLNRTGYRFISADASATLPTWTVNGTYSNVYQSSAVSAANGRQVTDMSTSAYVTYTDRNGVTQTLSNQPKRYRTLKRVTSTALVAAEAGTYFHDGTYLQVRPHDDRVLTGTTTMLATSDSNNGRMPAVSSATIYAENIDFVGGYRAFLALHADTVTGHILAFNGCSFQGAGTNGGLMIEAACKVYMYRCGAYDNATDGFNYHAAGNDAATEADAPSILEVECVVIGNGATGSSGTSDNASTAHEYTEVIALNCVYVNSDDSVVADINNAHRWMMGCHVGAALVTGAGRQNIKLANTGKMWLDGCFAEQGANDRWISETSTSTLYHFNSGTVVNGSGGAGVVRAYLG